MWQVARQAIADFLDDDCPTMAAALAYYTVFSLPPFLALVIAVAGLFFGTTAVEDSVEAHAGQLIGSTVATEVRTMMEQSRQQSGDSWWKVLMGIAALIFGATTAFTQLQTALNRAWEVKSNPTVGGLRAFLGKRLLSFGFVLMIGFFLLVSMVLTAAVTAFGNWIGHDLPSEALAATNAVLSLIVIAGLFGAMFKYLPDAEIRWSDVRVGALLTAVLFVIGKQLLGLYIGASDPAKAYGTAGSIILILLWIYYSSLLVLLGAEFTQAWAAKHGHHIAPEEGAIIAPDSSRPV